MPKIIIHYDAEQGYFSTDESEIPQSLEIVVREWVRSSADEDFTDTNCTWSEEHQQYFYDNVFNTPLEDK